MQRDWFKLKTFKPQMVVVSAAPSPVIWVGSWYMILPKLIDQRRYFGYQAVIWVGSWYKQQLWVPKHHGERLKKFYIFLSWLLFS
jgi:hypothetical protein